MIEFRHSNPKAFVPVENDGWQPKSQWVPYNFKRYDYRIFGVVYEKHNKAFEEAVKKHDMWELLKK